MDVMVGSPRVKLRSLPDVVISNTYNDVYDASHVLQLHNSTGAYTSNISKEQIVYTTKRLNQRAQSNYCNHKRETFIYAGGTAPIHLNNVSPAGWTTEYCGHHANICNALTSVINAVDTALVQTQSYVLSANGQGFINTAWDRLRPDLRSVSIPNFLADIEDLKTLYVLWKKRLTLAKNLAGLHLNYKFGWKPTVGDLADMIVGVKRLRAKLAAFKSAIGGTVKDGTNVKLDLPTFVTGTIAYPSGSHTVSYRATVSRKCTAYIAWQPQPLAVMGPMDEVLRGLLDSLGFELNPRIIWDALPFTFVIDWFFGVGSWLDRFRVDALELPVHLADSFLQYEEDLTIEWSWKRANDGTYTSIPEARGACYKRKFFHRMPIYPDAATLQGLGWRLPSRNQAVLGIALSTVLAKPLGFNVRGRHII